LPKSIFEKEFNKDFAEVNPKSHILKEAAEIFSKNGFSATVDQIAEKMGVTKGHIYYYFNSKQEILYQIFRQAMDYFMEEVEEANDSILPVDLRLKAIIRAHIIAICNNKAVMTVFMDLRQDLKEENWENIVVSRKKYEKLIQNLIRKGMEEGYFIKENEKLLSYTILGGINWVYVWFREDAEMSKDNLAEVMANYLVNGLRTLQRQNTYRTGKTIDKVEVNDSASLSKTISGTDIYFYTGITGDYDYYYLAEKDDIKGYSLQYTIPEGITTSLIYPVINNILPGVGSVILENSYRFKGQVYAGDTITATVIVSQKNVPENMLELKLEWKNQDEEVIAEGEAKVQPPVD